MGDFIFSSSSAISLPGKRKLISPLTRGNTARASCCWISFNISLGERGVEECLVLFFSCFRCGAGGENLGKINKEMEVWYDSASLFLLGQQFLSAFFYFSFEEGNIISWINVRLLCTLKTHKLDSFTLIYFSFMAFIDFALHWVGLEGWANKGT